MCCAAVCTVYGKAWGIPDTKLFGFKKVPCLQGAFKFQATFLNLNADSNILRHQRRENLHRVEAKRPSNTTGSAAMAYPVLNLITPKTSNPF